MHDHPISRYRNNHPVLHSSFPGQWIYFFSSPIWSQKDLLCLGWGRGTVGMRNQMALEMWTSMNSEGSQNKGSQNICVFQAAPTADGSRDTCAKEAERWEFATSRKGVLLTDWSFFLAAFASSDTSRLLWKQEVIITSTAFHGFYTSKFCILVTQWLKCHFYLNPPNIAVFSALFLTHWCY